VSVTGRYGGDVVFQVIPRERLFYDLLEQAADGVAVGARELVDLIDALPDATEQHQRIRELEHEGDDLTHRIMATLNTTFVTPFDRQDIHKLASTLDDVLDAVEAVSDLLVLHRVEEPFPAVRQQASVLVQITKAVAREIRHLRTLSSVERDWSDINRLEREGDHVYRRATADLFSGDHPAIEVLKWKDIVDQVEEAIDRCQSISNTMESIALKYA
jgi:Phosphate transport regulator (distant homolog of PhoU)